jgi:hypothetical protein
MFSRLAPSMLVALALATGCSGSRDEGAEPPATSTAADVAPSVASASASPATSAAPLGAPPVDAAAMLAKADGGCTHAPGVTSLTSPELPDTTRPLRVVTTASAGEPMGVVARAPDGSVTSLAAVVRMGPPASVTVALASPAAGKWRLVTHRAGEPVACLDIEVKGERARVDRFERSTLAWRTPKKWSRAEEDLFSAWVEALFDAPQSAEMSFGSMHAITADPARNVLHDHLGLGEDQPPPKGLRLDPDCADLPYFLRAYFAWKRGLPFGFSRCTRGGQGQAPKCLELSDQTTMGDLEEPPRDRVRRMEAFLRRRLKDTVHSGTGRTLGASDTTDYYPVDLRSDALRPGAIYADPYGHVLVVAKRVAPQDGGAGILFAVDGQPDGTVARKRFWRGNFLFAKGDPAFGSPGFKRFRPVSMRGGALRPMKNDAIAASADWGDYSLVQDELDVTGFFDRMDELVTPEPLDPERALLASVDALEEQLKARVRSIDNAEKHFAERGGFIDMPKGASIFETTGDWEDFSTPARDMRILIAIDVVKAFPHEVVRRPKRFVIPAGTEPTAVEKKLAEKLATELRKRTIRYTRMDGSAQALTLEEIVGRTEKLEVAYDPNDCPEVRWGAAEGTPEVSTCRRRANASQRLQMEKSRAWFRDRQRPPRP